MMKKYIVFSVDSHLGLPASGLAIIVRQPGVFNTKVEAEHAVKVDASSGILSFICETTEGYYSNRLSGKKEKQ